MVTGRAKKGVRTIDFAVNSIEDYETIAIALTLMGYKCSIL